MSAELPEIYLDHNASSPLVPAARAALLRALDAGPGNASSPHGAGRRLRRLLGDARASVAALIGARPEQLVFTSGTSESNALALRGALASQTSSRPISSRAVSSGKASSDAASRDRIAESQGRKASRASEGRLVTTDAEHEGLLGLVAALEGDGVAVARAGVDRAGRYATEDVRALVGDSPCVVAMCAAQSVTGAVQPVAEVCAGVRNAIVHVDAAQAVGRIACDVIALGCDLLSFSAHKLGGPQGIGALFVRDDAVLRVPDAATAQERGRRAGTEAVALAAAFGAAAEHAAQHVADWVVRGPALLAPLDALIARDASVTSLTPRDGLPNTRLLHVAGCRGDALLAALDARGIRVSTGTACASGARRPPHVLLAAGYPHDVARECLRISIGHDTRAADIAALVDALEDVAPRVRAALGHA